MKSGTAIRVDSSHVHDRPQRKNHSLHGPIDKGRSDFRNSRFQHTAGRHLQRYGDRFPLWDPFEGEKYACAGLKPPKYYCGCHLGGDQLIFQNNIVRDIGGVDDEAYAVGVNLTEGHMVVENNFFQNIYRQQSAAPDAAGQGCAIIINRTADNSLAKRIT